MYSSVHRLDVTQRHCLMNLTRGADEDPAVRSDLLYEFKCLILYVIAAPERECLVTAEVRDCSYDLLLESV